MNPGGQCPVEAAPGLMAHHIMAHHMSESCAHSAVRAYCQLGLLPLHVLAAGIPGCLLQSLLCELALSESCFASLQQPCMELHTLPDFWYVPI
jgi:hypothetical protein